MGGSDAGGVGGGVDSSGDGGGRGSGSAVIIAMVVAMVVATAVVAVALAVVVVSTGMILCFQKVRFSRFLKRRNGRPVGPTDRRAYGQTLL